MCLRGSAHCDGTSEAVRNTKELLDNEPLQSFDVVHKKNIDFKRFDLIPNTHRFIRETYLSGTQVDL
jgi:hypothetical protein